MDCTTLIVGRALSAVLCKYCHSHYGCLVTLERLELPVQGQLFGAVVARSENGVLSFKPLTRWLLRRSTTFKLCQEKWKRESLEGMGAKWYEENVCLDPVRLYGDETEPNPSRLEGKIVMEKWHRTIITCKYWLLGIARECTTRQVSWQASKPSFIWVTVLTRMAFDSILCSALLRYEIILDGHCFATFLAHQVIPNPNHS